MGSSSSDMNMDMDGMNMTSSNGSFSSSSMSMTMAMVFNTNLKTALYSNSWTPENAAAYTGTILFLIMLAVLFRVLLAGKSILEARWLETEMNRRYVVVQGKLPLAEKIARDEMATRMTLTENGVEEDVLVVERKNKPIRPWRLSVDPLRAALDTLLAAVGYFLMLAVMTVNAGYFLAVLGGTFLGSLIVGRYYTGTGGEH
ncbi:Ctr copper transporter family-domain-containing protein [Xylariaceae sp. FL0255]|nr:Ctr copper transporter family-domain-containing protein [Xylariaceae sp. FL0255]